MPAIFDIPTILNIAYISQYLAVCDIRRSGLYGGGMDVELPRKIYIVRKNVEWLYNLDPTDDTLRFTANYLYALCNRYVLEAQQIAGSGGTITPVVPIESNFFPIKVTGADFEVDGVTLNSTRLVGENLTLFVDQFSNNQLFAPDFFVYTATGIQIVEPGFDANNYPEILINRYTLL